MRMRDTHYQSHAEHGGSKLLSCHIGMHKATGKWYMGSRGPLVRVDQGHRNATIAS